MNTYRWLNKEKSRYYTLEVKKDESNSINLYYRWGSCISNRGGKKNIVVSTEEEVQIFIHQMMKRRKNRGYDLIGSLISKG